MVIRDWNELKWDVNSLHVASFMNLNKPKIHPVHVYEVNRICQCWNKYSGPVSNCFSSGQSAVGGLSIAVKANTVKVKVSTDPAPGVMGTCFCLSIAKGGRLHIPTSYITANISLLDFGVPIRRLVRMYSRFPEKLSNRTSSTTRIGGNSDGSRWDRVNSG